MIIDLILMLVNWMWNTYVSLFDMSGALSFLSDSLSSFNVVMSYLMKFDFILPVQFIVAMLVYILGVYALYLTYWFFMLVLLIWRSIKLM